MKPCRRPPAPDTLAAHGETWSQDYARRRQDDQAYKFQWRQHQEQRVNHTILPHLRSMTQAHCAYCDGYPLDDTAFETIDHFLPKHRYPFLVYAWENLYLACPMCQEKKEARFDTRIDPATYQEALVRPDDPEYRFERYFHFDYKEGTIEVNPRASAADRERAAYTIRCLGFNEGSRPLMRKRQLRDFSRLSPEEQEQELQIYPYRFLLET